MNFPATLCNGSLLPDFAAAAGLSGFQDNLVWFVNTYPMVTCYVAVVLLAVILLLLLRSRRARRDVRVYHNDGGLAVVSQKALRHLIYIACEDAGLASSPKICFRQARGRINVQIGLKLFQSQRLSDVHDLLRRRIRAAVEETHGIQVGDVSVKILGFRKDTHRQEPQEAEAYEADAVRSVPGEASAASLYEEPATDDETVADVQPVDTGADAAEDAAAQAEPKKRRFGFFGRRKEPVGDALFVSGEQDANAITPGNADGDTPRSDTPRGEVSGSEASADKATHGNAADDEVSHGNAPHGEVSREAAGAEDTGSSQKADDKA